MDMKKDMKLNTPARRAAFLGVLAATALVINRLEYLIPSFAFLPPGAKPGFSNVTVMLAVALLSPADAFVIVLIKGVFALVTRGLTAGLTAFCGGALSFAVTVPMLRAKRSPFGSVGAGIVGALAHNTGQLAAAVMITGTLRTAAYFPALAVFGLISGSLTGLVFGHVYRALKKLKPGQN